MGSGQRDSRQSFQADHGQEAIKCGWQGAIIAATKARWARVQGSRGKEKAAEKVDRRSSPAVRAKLAAAARARWAKARAAGRTTL